MVENNNKTYSYALEMTAKYGLLNSTILGAYLLSTGNNKSPELAIRAAQYYLRTLEKNGFLTSKRLREAKCFELSKAGFLYASEYFPVEKKPWLSSSELKTGMLPSVGHKSFAAGILEFMKQKTPERYLTTCLSEREMRMKFTNAEALKKAKIEGENKAKAIKELRMGAIPDGTFGIESEFTDEENNYYEDTFLIEVERSRFTCHKRIYARFHALMERSRKRFNMPGWHDNCRGIFIVANENEVFDAYHRAIVREFPKYNAAEDLGREPVEATGYEYKDVSDNFRIYLLNLAVFDYRKAFKAGRFDTIAEDFWVPMVVAKADFRKDWLPQISAIAQGFLKVVEQLKYHENPIDSPLLEPNDLQACFDSGEETPTGALPPSQEGLSGQEGTEALEERTEPPVEPAEGSSLTKVFKGFFLR